MSHMGTGDSRAVLKTDWRFTKYRWRCRKLLSVGQDVIFSYADNRSMGISLDASIENSTLECSTLRSSRHAMLSREHEDQSCGK
jgi:hypothetical protein